jgi:uncharacterized protein GlcG (DUF336 family)
VSISIEIARRIADACKQRARELRSPVSIAIVDAGGHLVLFERMMAPYGWATASISIAKATTAVMFNQSTDSVAQWGSGIPGFASSLAAMTQGRFIMAAGGWPIRLGGATIGGIGVSGGNAPGRDDEIARAGLAALEAIAPTVAPQPAYSSTSQPAASAPQPRSIQPVLSYPATTPHGGQPQSQPQARPPVAERPAPDTVYLAGEGEAEQDPYRNDQVAYDNTLREGSTGGQA